MVRRWLWLALLLGLTAAGTAAVVSAQLKPEYESTAALMIRPSQADSQPGYYVTFGQVAKTYGKLLTQRPLLQRVISELGLPARPEEIERHIAVAPERDSTLIRVGVRDPDPGRAAAIANTLVKDFIEDKLARERQEQLEIRLPIESLQDLRAQAGELEQRLAVVGRAIAEILARPASPDKQDALMTLEGRRSEELALYAGLLRAYAGIPLESLADGRARLRRLEQEVLAVGRTESTIRAMPVTPDQQERTVNLEQKREAALALYASVVKTYAVPTEPVGRYDALSLVAPATPAERPIWPNRLANTLIGGAVGLMIAVALAVLFESRRPRSSAVMEAPDAGSPVVGHLARGRGHR
jgi:capsular polysaccharide biosynthesis protein